MSLMKRILNHSCNRQYEFMDSGSNEFEQAFVDTGKESESKRFSRPGELHLTECSHNESLLFVNKHL